MDDEKLYWLYLTCETQTGQHYHRTAIICHHQLADDRILMDALRMLSFTMAMFEMGFAAGQYSVWQYAIEPYQNYEFN